MNPKYNVEWMGKALANLSLAISYHNIADGVGEHEAYVRRKKMLSYLRQEIRELLRSPNKTEALP